MWKCSHHLRNIAPSASLISSAKSIIDNNVVDHLKKHNLMSDKSNDFRFSRSSADVLIFIIHRISEAFNSKFITILTALVISKVFDKVWHRGSYTNSPAMTVLEETLQLTRPPSQ